MTVPTLAMRVVVVLTDCLLGEWRVTLLRPGPARELIALRKKFRESGIRSGRSERIAPSGVPWTQEDRDGRRNRRCPLRPSPRALDRASPGPVPVDHAHGPGGGGRVLDLHLGARRAAG